MGFIRVTDEGKQYDVNVDHIVSFRANNSNTGSVVELSHAEPLYVKECPRQIRSFIKKAQGLLPAPAKA